MGDRANFTDHSLYQDLIFCSGFGSFIRKRGRSHGGNVQAYGGQHLPDAVVEFPCEPPTLLILQLKQASRELP